MYEACRERSRADFAPSAQNWKCAKCKVDVLPSYDSLILPCTFLYRGSYSTRTLEPTRLCHGSAELCSLPIPSWLSPAPSTSSLSLPLSLLLPLYLSLFLPLIPLSNQPSSLPPPLPLPLMPSDLVAVDVGDLLDGRLAGLHLRRTGHATRHATRRDAHNGTHNGAHNTVDGGT